MIDYYSDEDFNKVQERYFKLLKENYKRYLENAKDLDYAKNLFTGVLNIELFSKRDKYQSRIRELFIHGYNIGFSIKEILESIKQINEDYLKEEERKKQYQTIDIYRNVYFKKYRILKKSTTKDPDGFIIRSEKYSLYKQLGLIDKVKSNKDESKEDELYKELNNNGVFLKQQRSIELLYEDKLSPLTSNVNVFFKAYVRFCTYLKMVEFFKTYEIKEEIQNPVLPDQIAEEEVVVKKGRRNKNKLTVKVPISIRSRDDHKTSLSKNQTVILFHYLQKNKVICSDTYLPDTDFAKIIMLSTGYSENTCRELLSSYGDKGVITLQDLQRVKENLEKIISLINSDLRQV